MMHEKSIKPNMFTSVHATNININITMRFFCFIVKFKFRAFYIKIIKTHAHVNAKHAHMTTEHAHVTAAHDHVTTFS